MALTYLDSSISYKVKKVARYIRLYGPSRTLAKVRGQLHVADDATFDEDTWVNPGCRNPDHPDRMVAIIGCGNFAHTTIAYYLKQARRKFLVSTYDVNPGRARRLCADYGGAMAVRNVDQILADPRVRLVYIASNHASHAEFAISCLDAGKNVHIEKPHVVTEDQLNRLADAQSRNPGLSVYLGFNRPKSPHFLRAMSALTREAGPTMINWFVAGHEIPEDHWYFSEEEGGRILGNLCHWTDLTLAMIGPDRAFPCEVVPATHRGSKSDFCVGMKFADGSVAGITFSAKGHTFEGVREVLQAHRGGALVTIRDFHETVIEVVDKRRRFRTLFREHGHKKNILDSFHDVLTDDHSQSIDAIYSTSTALLFLAVRQAISEQCNLMVDPDRSEQVTKCPVCK